MKEKGVETSLDQEQYILPVETLAQNQDKFNHFVNKMIKEIALIKEKKKISENEKEKISLLSNGILSIFYNINFKIKQELERRKEELEESAQKEAEEEIQDKLKKILEKEHDNIKPIHAKEVAAKFLSSDKGKKVMGKMLPDIQKRILEEKKKEYKKEIYSSWNSYFYGDLIQNIIKLIKICSRVE